MQLCNGKGKLLKVIIILGNVLPRGLFIRKLMLHKIAVYIKNVIMEVKARETASGQFAPAGQFAAFRRLLLTTQTESIDRYLNY